MFKKYVSTHSEQNHQTPFFQKDTTSTVKPLGSMFFQSLQAQHFIFSLIPCSCALSKAGTISINNVFHFLSSLIESTTCEFMKDSLTMPWCPTRGNHIAWPRWWILGCRRHRPRHSHALSRSPQGYHSNYTPSLPKEGMKRRKSHISWKSTWGWGRGQKETGICHRWDQKGIWKTVMEEEEQGPVEEIQLEPGGVGVLPPYTL